MQRRYEKFRRTPRRQQHFVCSDSGIPVYFAKVGTRVRFEGDVKRAIVDGFDELVRTISPPLLQHVTNPLTLERGYKGKDITIVTFDLIDGADYVEITCSPKALGSGRWAALEILLSRGVASASRSQRTTWSTVSVIIGPGACESVRALRWLSSEAPRFPMPGCTAGHCDCRYKNHDDRRADSSRSGRNSPPPRRRGAPRPTAWSSIDGP